MTNYEAPSWKPTKAEKPEAPSWKGPEDIKLRFGQRLAEIRTNKGYSQMELAMRAKLDRGHISVLENGHKAPSLETLQVLADALSLTISELVDTL